MKGILSLSWLLDYFLPVVLTLKNPTPTTDWYNSSPDDAHQKESLANGWFKYLSGHWGRKFNYGCSFTSPPVEPTLVRPYASFYLLVYLVGYYLLGQFSSMFGRFAYLGQLGHLAMVTVPIGLVIAGLNVGVLAHQLGGLFPARWVPDTKQGFFQTPSLMLQPADKTTMPAYVAQRVCSTALEPFARANDNNAAVWIQSTQSKLAQMKCPQQLWIAEISICLTHDAGTWFDKWHKEHTDKNWDIFKQDFLERFVLKDTALMIIHQVKNLTQTGTVKELTHAYKELCLCAPSKMAFDTPATHLCITTPSS
ncbi:hypothetical protein DSO57_1034441 [Entomophthora muscae]|uniref:Uncharacterized protein n=1 Tax=Entomophthora muscae TaxID=34485 RepID=A0ACC2SCT6_9FUNG|nr:hypothetical protein DSO57_1034441 [Entomophthora muscae]